MSALTQSNMAKPQMDAQDYLLKGGRALSTIIFLGLVASFILCFLGFLYLLTKPRVVSILTPKGRTSGVLMGECLQNYASASAVIPAIFAGLTIGKIDIGSARSAFDPTNLSKWKIPQGDTTFAEH